MVCSGSMNDFIVGLSRGSRSEDRAPQEKHVKQYRNAPRESTSPKCQSRRSSKSPTRPQYPRSCRSRRQGRIERRATSVHLSLDSTRLERQRRTVAVQVLTYQACNRNGIKRGCASIIDFITSAEVSPRKSAVKFQAVQIQASLLSTRCRSASVPLDSG